MVLFFFSVLGQFFVLFFCIYVCFVHCICLFFYIPSLVLSFLIFTAGFFLEHLHISIPLLSYHQHTPHWFSVTPCVQVLSHSLLSPPPPPPPPPKPNALSISLTSNRQKDNIDNNCDNEVRPEALLTPSVYNRNVIRNAKTDLENLGMFGFL